MFNTSENLIYDPNSKQLINKVNKISKILKFNNNKKDDNNNLDDNAMSLYGTYPIMQNKPKSSNCWKAFLTKINKNSTNCTNKFDYNII